MNLGDEVRDKITGFTGIAIARCDYLYGCISIEVMSQKLLNGKPVSIWVDDVQLDVLKSKKSKEAIKMSLLSSSSPIIFKRSGRKKKSGRRGGMNRSLPPSRQPNEPWH